MRYTEPELPNRGQGLTWKSGTPTTLASNSCAPRTCSMDVPAWLAEPVARTVSVGFLTYTLPPISTHRVASLTAPQSRVL